MSVTIEIQFPDELLPLPVQKARGAGVEPEQYLRSLVSRELSATHRLDEVLSAFLEQVTASGLWDDDLTEIFTGPRQEPGQQGG